MSDRPTVDQLDFDAQAELFAEPENGGFDFAATETIDDPEAEFSRHVADLLLHAMEPEIGRVRTGASRPARRPRQHRSTAARTELPPATITFGKQDCAFVVTEDPANPHRRTIEIVHPNLRSQLLRYDRARVVLDLDGVAAVSLDDHNTPYYRDGEKPPEFMGYALSETAVISPSDLAVIWEIPSGTEIRGTEFPDGPIGEILELTNESEET